MEPQSYQPPLQIEPVEPVIKPARKARAAAGRKPAAVRRAGGDVPMARTRKHAFSLTDNDMALIAALKQRSAGIGPIARKSSIVRAALHMLAAANGEDFAASLRTLTPSTRKKKS